MTNKAKATIRYDYSREYVVVEFRVGSKAHAVAWISDDHEYRLPNLSEIYELSKSEAVREIVQSRQIDVRYVGPRGL